MSIILKHGCAMYVLVEFVDAAVAIHHLNGLSGVAPYYETPRFPVNGVISDWPTGSLAEDEFDYGLNTSIDGEFDMKNYSSDWYTGDFAEDYISKGGLNGNTVIDIPYWENGALVGDVDSAYVFDAMVPASLESTNAQVIDIVEHEPLWEITLAKLNQPMSVMAKIHRIWNLPRELWTMYKIRDANPSSGIVIDTPVGRFVSERGGRVMFGTLDGTVPAVVKSNFNAGQNLMHEFSVLSALEGSGIAPKAYYLSDPLTRVGGRYMVTEEVGESFIKFCYDLTEEVEDSSIDEKRSALLLIVNVYKQAFNLVRKLHDWGFIHGDIHSWNIAVGKDGSNVWLIDFDMSVFYPAEFGTNENRVHKGLNLNHLSWQLYGFRMGRRDDVYRLFLTLAKVLNAKIQITLEDKYRNSIFPTAADSQITGIPEFDQISELLTSLVKTIRELPHPDSRPDYDTYMSIIERVIELLS